MSDLGQRLVHGEPAAFAELYDRCADRCHHYLTLFLGSRDAADDVLQETFVRLVRNRGKLADVENLPAYVFAIARNEAMRHAGRRAREQQRLILLSSSDLFADTDDVARRDTAQAVADGLQRLSAEQREVVELKIYGGLTFREIADVTSVPLQTAATRYRSALEHLKAWFARQPS
jgi:RNA polymerase sigma-70 factor (ECF subfamily)